MDSIVLQFSTSTAWQSGLIRVVTKSEFSHCDVVVTAEAAREVGISGLMPFGQPYGLLGASDPGGVMIRGPSYHQFRLRRRMTLKTDKAADVLKRLVTQIGKPFDNEALVRTYDLNWGPEWRDPDKWYCIELVIWALLEEGFFETRPWPVAVRLNHITPEDGINLLAGEFDPSEFGRDYNG
jgi:hypothetical protein